jgi:hypothetical protein
MWRAGLEEYGEVKGLGWKWQAADAAITKAPLGGQSTGANLTDRAKRGTKRSLLVKAKGVPLAIKVSPAHRHKVKMLAATLDGIVVDRPAPSEQQKQNLCLNKGYCGEITQTSPYAKENIMRIARIWPRFIALISVFALMITGAQPNVILKQHADGQDHSMQEMKKIDTDLGPVRTQANSVTIFLHGLMVGRYKKGGKKSKRFELGIIKRAPQHVFSFSVYSKSSPKCTDITEDVKKGNWVFEVRDDQGSIARDISMWSSNANSSSSKTTDAEKLLEQSYDSKYILNIEGPKFHKGKVDRYKKPFKRVFYFHNGTIRTVCPTFCLEKRRLETEEGWKNIGPMAEVVGVDITLRAGQRLVLRSEKDERKVLWENSYKCDPSDPKCGEAANDRVEGRVLNLSGKSPNCCDKDYTCESCATRGYNYTPIPARDLSKSLEDIICNHTPPPLPEANEEEGEPTDFQLYYYMVFKIDRMKRFELRKHKDNKSLILSLETPKPKQIACIPPYRCGMVLVDSGKIDIDK